jgi:hypothetical protein
MKRSIDKLDFIKIYKIILCELTIKRIERQATDWEKIFAEDIVYKGL